MRTASFVSLIFMGLGSIGIAQADTPPAIDWSGYYMGADLGGARGDSRTRASVPVAGSSYFTSTDFAQVENAGKGSMSEWRPFAGIHGGYGKLHGNMFLGIEASAIALNMDNSRSETVTWLTTPTSRFTLQQSIKTDWLVALRPRLGWAQGQWLAYATGGLAISRIKHEITFSDTFNAGARGQGSNSKTKAGWALGAGGEYALNKAWSVRGELMHYDFGDVDTSAVVTNPSFAGLSNQINSKADLRINTLSIGITYRY